MPVCVCAASHRILLQRLQNWDKARRMREEKTREKDRGKVRCGRVNRSGWIERQRQTRGKRPTCAEGEHQDIKVERQRHREKKDMRETESREKKTAKDSLSVKLPAS